MRLVERYLIKKDNNKDKLYLFRCGNFYIFINDDAKEICNLTTLKLTSVGNNFKCGFPVNSLDKYLNLFNNLKLNIEVVESENPFFEKNEKVEENSSSLEHVSVSPFFEETGFVEKEESRQKEQDINTVLKLLLKELTPRERFIVTKYNGIGEKKPKTLEEIGSA